MATVRTLLNNVLRGLRKGQISTSLIQLSDDYHLLLLQLLNTAKEEIEESWDWQALRTTATVTGTGGVADYILASGGVSDTEVPEEARLLYAKRTAQGYDYETSTALHDTQPQVFDTTDSNEFRLTEVSEEQIQRWRLTDNDLTDSRPGYFALTRNADNIRLLIYPAPSDARIWKLRFVIPQPELTIDDLDTAVNVPARPIWTRALHYANEERGEELGRPNSSLAHQADDALANAIARERTDEDDTSYPV